MKTIELIVKYQNLIVDKSIEVVGLPTIGEENDTELVINGWKNSNIYKKEDFYELRYNYPPNSTGDDVEHCFQLFINDKEQEYPQSGITKDEMEMWWESIIIEDKKLYIIYY